MIDRNRREEYLKRRNTAILNSKIDIILRRKFNSIYSNLIAYNFQTNTGKIDYIYKGKDDFLVFIFVKDITNMIKKDGNILRLKEINDILLNNNYLANIDWFLRKYNYNLNYNYMVDILCINREKNKIKINHIKNFDKEIRKINLDILKNNAQGKIV